MSSGIVSLILKTVRGVLPISYVLGEKYFSLRQELTRYFAAIRGEEIDNEYLPSIENVQPEMALVEMLMLPLAEARTAWARCCQARVRVAINLLLYDAYPPETPTETLTTLGRTPRHSTFSEDSTTQVYNRPTVFALEASPVPSGSTTQMLDHRSAVTKTGESAPSVSATLDQPSPITATKTEESAPSVSSGSPTRMLDHPLPLTATNTGGSVACTSASSGSPTQMLDTPSPPTAGSVACTSASSGCPTQTPDGPSPLTATKTGGSNTCTSVSGPHPLACMNSNSTAHRSAEPTENNASDNKRHHHNRVSTGSGSASSSDTPDECEYLTKLDNLLDVHLTSDLPQCSEPVDMCPQSAGQKPPGPTRPSSSQDILAIATAAVGINDTDSACIPPPPRFIESRESCREETTTHPDTPQPGPSSAYFSAQESALLSPQYEDLSSSDEETEPCTKVRKYTAVARSVSSTDEIPTENFVLYSSKHREILGRLTRGALERLKVYIPKESETSRRSSPPMVCPSCQRSKKDWVTFGGCSHIICDSCTKVANITAESIGARLLCPACGCIPNSVLKDDVPAFREPSCSQDANEHFKKIKGDKKRSQDEAVWRDISYGHYGATDEHKFIRSVCSDTDKCVTWKPERKELMRFRDKYLGKNVCRLCFSQKRILGAPKCCERRLCQECVDFIVAKEIRWFNKTDLQGRQSYETGNCFVCGDRPKRPGRLVVRKTILSPEFENYFKLGVNRLPMRFFVRYWTKVIETDKTAWIKQSHKKLVTFLEQHKNLKYPMDDASSM